MYSERHGGILIEQKVVWERFHSAHLSLSQNKQKKKVIKDQNSIKSLKQLLTLWADEQVNSSNTWKM